MNLLGLCQLLHLNLKLLEVGIFIKLRSIDIEHFAIHYRFEIGQFSFHFYFGIHVDTHQYHQL